MVFSERILDALFKAIEGDKDSTVFDIGFHFGKEVFFAVNGEKGTAYDYANKYPDSLCMDVMVRICEENEDKPARTEKEIKLAEEMYFMDAYNTKEEVCIQGVCEPFCPVHAQTESWIKFNNGGW